MVGEEGQRIVGLLQSSSRYFLDAENKQLYIDNKYFFLIQDFFSRRTGHLAMLAISSTKDQTQTLKAYSSSKNTNEIEII